MLHFLSGKEKGRELVLPDGQDVVLGRDDTGEFLVDDFRISKKEAVISVVGDFVNLRDTGAATGISVNGQKVTQAALKEGDRIRLSGVMLMLVAVNRFSENFQTQVLKKGDSDFAKAPPKATMLGAGTLGGTIKEVPVAEMLQFLSNSRKSGVLKLESGNHLAKVYLRDGSVFYASIDGALKVHPQKHLFRVLRWTEGSFEFGPPEPVEGKIEILEPTSGLLLDGVQQADEMARIIETVPSPDKALRLAKPIPGAIRHCTPDELDVIQLVLEYGTVQGVIDFFPVNQPEVFVSDVEIFNSLSGLIKKGFVIVG